MCTHTMQQLASVVRTNKTLRRLDLSGIKNLTYIRSIMKIMTFCVVVELFEYGLYNIHATGVSTGYSICG